MESVNEFTDRMKSALEEAKAALAKAKDDMARYYNHRRTPATIFRPGDKVFLDASDIKTTRPSQKLSHKRLGPFKVLKQVGNSAYKLQLPPTMSRLHPVFNVVKLTPAPADPFPGRRTKPPPPPVLVAGEEEYEVEKILDSRTFRRQFQFLVKWKGYGYEENTWVNEREVHAPDRVQDFYRANPGAPRRIRYAQFDGLPFSSPADLATTWRPLTPVQRVAAP
jgi:hypothetical protein